VWHAIPCRVIDVVRGYTDRLTVELLMLLTDTVNNHQIDPWGLFAMPLRSGLIGLLLLLVLAACSTVSSGADGDAATADPVELRLGYFPNVTHASAIVAIEHGETEAALGDNVTLTTQFFNAGTDAVEALFSEAIDATFIGPNPAINAYAQSNGEAIRIIAGAASGGASLVVSDAISSPADLADATLSTPSLGNTQDVALRAWLADQGYTTDLEGGGDVSVMPQANGDALQAFIQGDIDGAWVPEPWATRMIEEGNGHVLVDEHDLWPDGEFVTTHLVVATSFLEAHPDVVKQLLEGHVAATEFVNENPEEAQQIVGDAIKELTDTELPEGTLAAAWENLTFTVDPIASSLTTSAENAAEIGLLDPVDLGGIYDLTLLNEVLSEAGKPQVADE
jgi:NitT/TauT family transport system substrate-binding protein